MRAAIDRAGPFVVSFALTSLFFLQMCDWMFACGCQPLWSGADALCNVHLQHAARHCPICTRGLEGQAGMMTVMALPQLAVSLWWRKTMPMRMATSILLVPSIFALAGALLGYTDGYWR